MKTGINTSVIAIVLFVALAAPAWLAAQQHPRYKLIDLGTLGGPHSYGSVNGEGFSLLNNSGEVASYADLALPDPNASFFLYGPRLRPDARLSMEGRRNDRPWRTSRK